MHYEQNVYITIGFCHYILAIIHLQNNFAITADLALWFLYIISNKLLMIDD